MCIRDRIEEINFDKKTVLDFGCGSGILSIATQKMKASKVWSIDTDEFAIISSKENLKRSNLNVENLIEGSIENLDNKLKFDVILANISSNIIMKYSNEMKRKLNQNGILIASGILSKNIEETLEKLQKAGFKLLSQTVEEEWECLVLK